MNKYNETELEEIKIRNKANSRLFSKSKNLCIDAYYTANNKIHFTFLHYLTNQQAYKLEKIFGQDIETGSKTAWTID